MLKRLFRNNAFQILSIIVLVVLFWYPIMFENEFFYDDWSFIDKFKQGIPSFGYFLTPHNEHFMPMFKGIFFMMFKLFNLNIAPYMGLSIIFLCLNSIVLLFLLKEIFGKNKLLPYCLTLFFTLNVTYFEVMHWFVNLSQAIMLFFIMLTLLLFHKAYKESNKKLYVLSVITSFFMPMNFLMGFMGIFFLIIYYFLLLRKEPEAERLGSLKMSATVSPAKTGFDRKCLWPFIFVWLLFLIIYLSFSLPTLLNRPSTAPPLTFAPAQLVFFFILGIVGLYLRNMGYSILVFPYTTGLAVFLTIISLIFGLFLFLYFILNKKNDRIPLFWGNREALFGFVSLFVCYAILAFGRASLEPISFLGWGRYHYLPMFFLTILMGVFIPQMIKIFSKIFNEQRLKVFIVVIFVIFIATHFILIRQKAFSPVRTEGNILQQVEIPS